MAAADRPESEDVEQDLADWLKEAGRRKPVAEAPEPQLSSKPDPQAFETRRLAIMLACLSVAYLQYFYFGVMLEISSLHSVVSFVASAPTP